MRKTLFVLWLSVASAGAIAISSCAVPAPPPRAPAGASQAQPAPPTQQAKPAVAKAAMVKIGDTKLGKILVGDNGMTLYLFTKDANGESACYDQCAQNWPPLLTEGAPQVGEGVDAKLLGTTKRKDGAMQVTYNGLPLYYFAKDKAVGDTMGQDVGEVWYVVLPSGKALEEAEEAGQAGEAAEVKVGETSLGKVLVGEKGMTLYVFAKDANGESACYDQCAQNWPPLLTEGEPKAGEGADAKLLSTTKRKDGKLQVTYNSMPLYYFAKDKAIGDVTGQKVGEVWFVVAPSGDALK